jgi:hypothetical protein
VDWGLVVKLALPGKVTRINDIYRVSQNSRIPNSEIKEKSGLPPQRYIGLKVHSLKCVFFKYSRKSSVFIVIYGVDDCGK